MPVGEAYSLEYLIKKSIDVSGIENCEVRIREDGKVIWINVNGVCVCRVCRIENLEVNDDRRK